MNYEKQITKPFAKMPTLQLRAYRGFKDKSKIFYLNNTSDSIDIITKENYTYIKYINSKGFNKTIVLDSSNTIMSQKYLWGEKELLLIKYKNSKIESIYNFNQSVSLCDVNLILKFDIEGNIIEEVYGNCTENLIEGEDEYGKYSSSETVWNSVAFNTKSTCQRIGKPPCKP